jgi:hypothetical protein
MSTHETKKLIHWGWVTGEKRMLRELQKQAKNGWLLSKCSMYHLILKKNAPLDIQYAVDLPPLEKEDEAEYLRYFEETGWHLACKNGFFYIFYADRNSAPIHTDRTLLNNIRKKRIKWMIPITAFFLLLTVGLILFSRTPMSFPVEIAYILLTAISAGLLGLYGTVCVSLLFTRNNF